MDAERECPGVRRDAAGKRGVGLQVATGTSFQGTEQAAAWWHNLPRPDSTVRTTLPSRCDYKALYASRNDPRTDPADAPLPTSGADFDLDLGLKRPEQDQNVGVSKVNSEVNVTISVKS